MVTRVYVLFLCGCCVDTKTAIDLAIKAREVIQPLIQQGLSNSEIDENIKNILLGDGKGIW